MSATKTSLRVRVRDWWAEARANPYFRYGLTAAFIVAALDRLTKYWIVNIVELPVKEHIEISRIFDLSYVENTGASFGMLAGGLSSRIILSVIVSGVVIGLLSWLGRLRRPIATTGVAFIIGGALGNLYDRLAYGYVVDFLNFSGLMFPWVFNIADMAVNVGVAFLILDAWQTRKRPPDAR